MADVNAARAAPEGQAAAADFSGLLKKAIWPPTMDADNTNANSLFSIGVYLRSSAASYVLAFFRIRLKGRSLDLFCYHSKMPRTTEHVILIALAVLASSCAPPVAPDTRAADESALRALDEQWSATAAKNDLDGTVAFYSEDAVLLPPNAPVAADRKSIRETWAGLLGPNTALSWKVSKAEVAKSGELGYLYGTYQLSIKDPKGGPAIDDRGKFLEVWKKQPDGKWRCIVDTYNSDIPVPAAPEPKK